MIHIALLIPTIDRIGGAEQQVILLGKGLARRGWKVTIVALSGYGGPNAADLAAAGADFITLEMQRGLVDPRGWLRFHRWLRHAQPDVVHAHLPHAAWLMRWSRLAAPVRVALDTIHTSSTGTAGRRIGYRRSDWLADQVTAVSNSVADAWLSKNMISSRTVTVMPNGVDVDQWKPDPLRRRSLRRKLGLTDEFLWLAAGRLEAVKDYPLLLRAFSHVPAPARLMIAGAGALQSELLSLVNELSLGARVRFLGFEPDLRRWMQAADGFVLSSRWEGLPMGLLEASACALPIVSTDAPGCSEIITDGYTGLLSAVGNEKALASSMIRLMRTSPRERRAMGERAQLMAIERFDLELILSRWEALYRGLLLRNQAPLRWAHA
ncbi:MAG TPA: glycosyltransferase family 4 protein [Terracidiphilus sp.]|nr:glycosyltransferase family 4 protein [Terracidiphilus sp.]